MNRLEIGRQPDDQDGERAAGETATLAERAYNRLRSDIISGVYRPNEKLQIDKLKEAYQIGASPLREALSKLSSDGLVKIVGQRGFRVTALSASDLRDVTNVRLLLETEALRQAIEHGDEAWEAAIVASYYRLKKVESRLAENLAANLDDWEARNREFHDALVAACPSAWLIRLRSMLYDQHERYRSISRLRTKSGRDIDKEHKEIMDAALARDVDHACEAAGRHIRLTAEAILSQPDLFDLIDNV